MACLSSLSSLFLASPPSPSATFISLPQLPHFLPPHTTQVSDFGDREVFCQKCVPKVAPLQANETVEMERATRAGMLNSEVRFGRLPRWGDKTARQMDRQTYR